MCLWDFYPQGFNCGNPGTWPEVDTIGLDTSHQVSFYGLARSSLADYPQTIYADVTSGSGEFGGDAFDPWGGVGLRFFLSSCMLDMLLQSGYDKCALLTNEQYANVRRSIFEIFNVIYFSQVQYKVRAADLFQPLP